MGEGTTLLSYEMGWQLRLFDLMAASQQSGDYVMACTYGISLLQILGIESIPQKQIGGTKVDEQIASWQKFYNEILLSAVGQIRTTINNVRKHYKPEMTVPKYKSPTGAN